VLLAWGITFAVAFSEIIPIPHTMQPYFVSLMVVLASITTALALGLKNILLAVLLALPGGLFIFYTLILLGGSFLKFLDVRLVEASMLFFLFSAVAGPLLIPRCKDENLRSKIYQGALLLMVLLTATTYLLLYLDMLPPK